MSLDLKQFYRQISRIPANPLLFVCSCCFRTSLILFAVNVAKIIAECTSLSSKNTVPQQILFKSVAQTIFNVGHREAATNIGAATVPLWVSCMCEIPKNLGQVFGIHNFCILYNLQMASKLHDWHIQVIINCFQEFALSAFKLFLNCSFILSLFSPKNTPKTFGGQALCYPGP